MSAPNPATNPWMLPKITDYLDSRTDAVQRFVDKLEVCSDPSTDLNRIKEAVTEHLRVLPLKWMLKASCVIADDLYKAGNSLLLWSERHRQYIVASGGTFFQHLQSKGYAVRYGINNSFEWTDEGMQRPLVLLPKVFAAAGLVYVCPQTLSLQLMEHDGTAGGEFLTSYARYELESRHVALLLVKRCNAMRKNYVVLELGDDQELLTEISADSQSNIVTVFRTEAPVAGSNITINLPEAPDPSAEGAHRN